MQLNQFTDIALKSLIYLKQVKRQVTINEIAEVFVLPRNHLIKVLNFMVKESWVKSIRGRNGGLIYRDSSDELRLGDVIAKLECRQELLNCPACILGGGCLLRSILHESLNAFYDNLNRYVIKDLVDNNVINLLQPLIITYQNKVRDY